LHVPNVIFDVYIYYSPNPLNISISSSFHQHDAFKNYLFTDLSCHHFRFQLDHFYPSETWPTQSLCQLSSFKKSHY